MIKIVKVIIKLDVSNATEDEKDHATILEFSGNMWTMNGSVFPRFMRLMNILIGEK